MLVATKTPPYAEASRDHRDLNGCVLPSVSQILKATGVASDFSNVSPFVLERKRLIGQAVHAATHYFDDGDLNELTIAREVIPYLEAWKVFRDERCFKPILLETVVYSHAHHYIGRFDRFGVIPPARLVLADIKTGDPRDAAADLQTAGYEVAFREQHPEYDDRTIERWSIQLCDDGRYKLTPYHRRHDRSDFLALAKATNLRLQRNGGIPPWM